MTRVQPFFVAVALGGATVAGLAQPRGDATRRERVIDTALLVRPDAKTIATASMGFDELVCDITWVRAVLTFGERYDRDGSAEWRDWLVGMIDVAVTLDPNWLTVYQYGGGMLRVVGETDASTSVYTRCADTLPDNAWCPFAAGMNYYLGKGDAATASTWIARAAERPGAPGWWSSAAGRMKTESGGLQTALHFIDDQLAGDPPEAERDYLLLQKARIQHDLLVETWAAACREHFSTTGAPLASPEQVAKLGFTLPENPRKDEWIVGRDGVVRSAAAERERVRRVVSEEWSLVRPIASTPG